MVAKSLISVRIPVELLQKIESVESSKSDVITQALEKYFDNESIRIDENKGESSRIHHVYDSLQSTNESLIKQLEEKDDQIKRKDDQIDDLTRLLDQAQKLQLAAQSQKLIEGKRRWKFWR